MGGSVYIPFKFLKMVFKNNCVFSKFNNFDDFGKTHLFFVLFHTFTNKIRIKNMDKLIGREKVIKQLNDYVASDRFSMPYSFCTLRYFWFLLFGLSGSVISIYPIASSGLIYLAIWVG